MSEGSQPAHRYAICPAQGLGYLRPLLRAMASEGIEVAQPFSETSLVPEAPSARGRERGFPAKTGRAGGPGERKGSPERATIDLALLLWPPSLGPAALGFMVKELRALSRPLRAHHGALVLVYPGDVPAFGKGAGTPGAVEALGRSLVRSFALEYAPEARINFVVGGGRGKPGVRGPRSRTGDPLTANDLVRAALFLGGEGARFITGETLPVDGGAHLFWTAGGEG